MTGAFDESGPAAVLSPKLRLRHRRQDGGKKEGAPGNDGEGFFEGGRTIHALYYAFLELTSS